MSRAVFLKMCFLKKLNNCLQVLIKAMQNTSGINVTIISLLNVKEGTHYDAYKNRTLD
ncbi:hypothetical protein SCACP_13920 [Sporomusa carbonis]